MAKTQLDTDLVQLTGNAYIGNSNGWVTFSPLASINKLHSTNGGFAAYQGIRYNASAHYWGVGASADSTQAMTLDASGNLLVNTATARGRKLEVSGDAAFGRGGIPVVIKDNAGTDYGNDIFIPHDGGSSTQRAFRLRTSYNGGSAKFSIARSTNSSAYNTDVSTLTYAEDLIIDGSGNLLVGVTTATAHRIEKSVTNNAGNAIFGLGSQGASSMIVFGTGQYVPNAANCSVALGRDNNTLRSLNASGTLNASGADVAEYYWKRAGCPTISKGQIVGIDDEGKITDRYDDAVSGFLIKSTNPYIVGGDVWGTEEAIGCRRPEEPQLVLPNYDGPSHPGDAPAAPQDPQLVEPVPPQPPADLAEDATEEEQAAYVQQLVAYQEALLAYQTELEGYREALAAYEHVVQAHLASVDAYNAAMVEFEAAQEAHEDECAVVTAEYNRIYHLYLADLHGFNAKLEEARQQVDRLALCGQVPLNLNGATPGQYVVPVRNEDGSIGISLVSKGDMRLPGGALDARYMDAVGIVQNILPDGRANVRVKPV